MVQTRAQHWYAGEKLDKDHLAEYVVDHFGNFVNTCALYRKDRNKRDNRNNRNPMILN